MTFHTYIGNAILSLFNEDISNRVYRSAWSREDALYYIGKNSGKLFDPYIVHAFLTVIDNETMQLMADLEEEEKMH